MKLNATEKIIRELGEIDAKIKQLESSPNRAFVLLEYETLVSFHYFNLFFKQFWNEFDRHSASQLLLYLKIIKTYSELSNRYVSLLREQLDYLESVVDIHNKCFEDLPPVIFTEDETTDVVGYYLECLKDEKDEDGEPLYYIDLDSDTDIVNGRSVPIDVYSFTNDKLNDGYYNSLYGLHTSLKGIYDLMCVLSSYPDQLQSDNTPNKEDIINAIEKGLRQYAKEIGKKVERDLRKTAQSLKASRNASLTPDVWGLVMQEEDDLFDLAIKGLLEENKEGRFEHLLDAQRKQWTENYPLLQKIKTTCLDGELFDIRLAVETHQLLSSLNADNLDLFYELVLRRNIIQREMFPGELEVKYEEWVNPSEEHHWEDSEDSNLRNSHSSSTNNSASDEEETTEELPQLSNALISNAIRAALAINGAANSAKWVGVYFAWRADDRLVPKVYDYRDFIELMNSHRFRGSHEKEVAETALKDYYNDRYLIKTPIDQWEESGWKREGKSNAKNKWEHVALAKRAALEFKKTLD